jgi:hypothetical protein
MLQLFGMVYSILVVMEVRAGLGRKSGSLTDEESISVQKVSSNLACDLHGLLTCYGQMVFASDMLYVWALFSSKLAVCFLVKRLCIARVHVTLANSLTYASAGLGVVSLLVVGIGKRIADPWNIAARSTVWPRQ